MTNEKQNETFTWLQPGTWRKLNAMIEYVKANAERAWQRRQNPDLFRIRRKTELCGLQFTSMGNHFLLDWPSTTVTPPFQWNHNVTGSWP